MSAMMATTSRGDLNLNLNLPPLAFADSVKEGLKEGLRQAMLHHEVIFKNQVRELHRLYWTQKNLMNELCFKWQSASTSARSGEEECKGLAKVNDEQLRGPLVNSTLGPGTSLEFQINGFRNFDLQLPVNDFICVVGGRDVDEFLQVKDSGYNQCASDNDHSKVNCSTGVANFLHGQIDLNAHHVIDLEESLRPEPCEEASVICSSGFNALSDDGADMSCSRVTVLSDFGSLRGMLDESGNVAAEERLIADCQSVKWLQKSSALTDAGLKEAGSSCYACLPHQNQHSTPKHLHIDLNTTQDDEFMNVFADPVQTFPSPSTSSSVVCNGDQLKELKSKFLKDSEPSGQCPRDPILIVRQDLASIDSENWLPHGLKDDHPSLKQGSEDSTKIIEDAWNFERCIIRNDGYRSRVESPVECYRSSAKIFTSASNGGTQNSTGGTDLSYIGLRTPAEENFDSSLQQPHFLVNDLSSRHASIASNDIVENCLYASAGSINLPTSAAGGSGEKKTSTDESEEDTLSSHAIDPCDQQLELENFLHGQKLDELNGSKRCSFESKNPSDIKTISSPECFESNLESSDPERLCSRHVPIHDASAFVCILDQPCKVCVPGSQEGIEKQSPAIELDLMIVEAAETLVSIHSENKASPDHLTSNGQKESESEQGHDQPQYSSDSFEMIALKLEEDIDDGNSKSAPQVEKVAGKDVCGVRPGRRRGLRDFQKEILPGLVSLSRHEICEDIHTIKYQTRKSKSGHEVCEDVHTVKCQTRKSTSLKTCEENLSVPVRSKRSRLRQRQ